MSDARDRSQILNLTSGASVGLATFGARDGFPVLALHGAPACRLMFDVADDAARALGLTLYCPDRPGYGLTPHDGGGSLGTRTALNLEIADALGLERFSILAISGGGPYGVALAARCPKRVAGLALVSPMGPVRDFLSAGPRSDIAGAGVISAGHRWFFTRLPDRRRLLRAIAMCNAGLVRLAPWLSLRLLGLVAGRTDRRVLAQPDVAASLQGMTREALAQGVEGGVSDLAIYARSWTINWEEVTAPCLLWQGTRDRIVPMQAAFWLARQLEGCRLTRLEGAGHFWVYNHVSEVLGELKRISQW